MLSHILEYRHTQAMTAADSTAERYADVMNSLIADCAHLEDRVAELENQLRATARERDDAVAAQAAAERERDQALQDLEDVEGTFGEEDLREYCEVCNHHWHQTRSVWMKSCSQHSRGAPMVNHTREGT